jgi:hypothetical protein
MESLIKLSQTPDSTYYAVLLEKGALNIKVRDTKTTIGWVIDWELPKPFAPGLIFLPGRNIELIGTLSELKEDQARDVMESIHGLYGNPDLDLYKKDLKMEIQSKGVNPEENTIVIIKAENELQRKS